MRAIPGVRVYLIPFYSEGCHASSIPGILRFMAGIFSPESKSSDGQWTRNLPAEMIHALENDDHDRFVSVILVISA
jgi:hypothetical protein